MLNIIVLPFDPDAMTPTHLAAASYLARYSDCTHRLYAYGTAARTGAPLRDKPSTAPTVLGVVNSPSPRPRPSAARSA